MATRTVRSAYPVYQHRPATGTIRRRPLRANGALCLHTKLFRQAKAVSLPAKTNRGDVVLRGIVKV
jgi:hypothetical protein